MSAGSSAPALGGSERDADGRLGRVDFAGATAV